MNKIVQATEADFGLDMVCTLPLWDHSKDTGCGCTGGAKSSVKIMDAGPGPGGYLVAPMPRHGNDCLCPDCRYEG